MLAFTIISWYCGLLRLPIHLSLIPFAALLVYHFSRHHYTREDLMAAWRWEGVFLLFFLLMLDVRFFNPTISYAEKFMDHAFLASVMRSPEVPPLDPWFSGGTMNVYYYLGYWMFGCLGIVSGVPSNIAFNLALPTIFGLTAVSLCMTGSLLLDRFRWLPLTLLFIPNPSFFLQILQGKAWTAVFWDSTRTISNTINEYPLFSFLWGDLHPHVISLFNQAFLVFLLIFLYMMWNHLRDRGKWILGGAIAISLGSMPLINTWDVLIYAPLTVFCILLMLKRNRQPGERNAILCILLAVPALAVLCYLPFYLQLQAHTGGIGIVHTPSAPSEFLLVNGLFILILFLVLIQQIRDHPLLLLTAVPFLVTGYYSAAIIVVPLAYLAAGLLYRDEGRPEDLLAFFGLVILLGCELLYLKDNMGEVFFRMNTVFKTYLPAWLLLGIATSVMTGRWLSRVGRIPRVPCRITAIIAIVVICFLFAIPPSIQVSQDYGKGTLDGLAYLDQSHPGDAAAVMFLRTLHGNEIIVEAEGGDYTYYSRISSFTGIPGIIGMPFHEYMWRGDDTGWFGTRSADVRSIYEDPEATVPLMKKYHATLLYLGDSERERYTVRLPETGLRKIYSAGGTEIFRIQ